MTSFPDTEPFKHLVRAARNHEERIVVRDLNTCIEANAYRLLHDTKTFIKSLRAGLDEATLRELDFGSGDVFIAVLVPAGYEFVVVYCACKALGAALLPLSPAVHPAEALEFMSLCDAKALVTGTGVMSERLLRLAHDSDDPCCRNLVQIGVGINPNWDSGASSEAFTLSPASTCERAGVVLFTSGTTGSPKGVVHAWSSIDENAASVQEWASLGSSDLHLHNAPVHWIGGFTYIMVFLNSDACIEFCAGVWSPAWFWSRMLRGGVTYVGLGPGAWIHLADYFRANIAGTSREGEYSAAVGRLRVAVAAGAPLPQEQDAFWTRLRGARLLNAWASTECLLSSRPALDGTSEKGTVGPLDRRVKYKIVGSDEEGELLIKVSWLFKRYISRNKDIMQDIIDPDGYFRTGDLASECNGSIKIHGRASTDVIRFAGWKIFAPDVESVLTSLDSIVQAFVCGITDAEHGQRVAAVVRAVGTQPALTLANLRIMLRPTDLPMYKWPTVLHVLRPGEELPLVLKGTVSRVKARELYFPQEDSRDDRTVEVWDIGVEMKNTTSRPWDWAGIAT